MVSKTELRKQLRAVQGDWTVEDEKTARALLFCPQLLFADRVFAFVPLIRSEPDITSILSDYPIALPVCLSDGSMEFHAVPETWKDHVAQRKMGIWEPTDGEIVTPTASSVILVPGMAFTREGLRLGRGKGYYDRYLARYPKAITIGVCRSYQLVGELPSEAWDIPVSHVLAGGTFAK